MAARSSFAVCLLYCGYIEQVFGAGCRPGGAAQWSSEARQCTEQVPDTPSRPTLCLTFASVRKLKEMDR